MMIIAILTLETQPRTGSLLFNEPEWKSVQKKIEIEVGAKRTEIMSGREATTTLTVETDAQRRRRRQRRRHQRRCNYTF